MIYSSYSKGNFFSTFELLTNSKLKREKIQFGLLTRWLNFYFFTFRLLTHDEWLGSEKQNILLRVTNSKLKFLFFRFWVTKSHFDLLTAKLKKKNLDLELPESSKTLKHLKLISLKEML